MKRVVYLIILLLIIFWLAIFVAANLDEVPVNWLVENIVLKQAQNTDVVCVNSEYVGVTMLRTG